MSSSESDSDHDDQDGLGSDGEERGGEDGEKEGVEEKDNGPMQGKKTFSELGLVDVLVEACEKVGALSGTFAFSLTCA